MNAKKLKTKIIENKLTVTIVANQIGISGSSLYRKLRGDDQITVYEAYMLKSILHMTNLEALEIFL